MGLPLLVAALLQIVPADSLVQRLTQEILDYGKPDAGFEELVNNDFSYATAEGCIALPPAEGKNGEVDFTNRYGICSVEGREALVTHTTRFSSTALSGVFVYFEDELSICSMDTNNGYVGDEKSQICRETSKQVLEEVFP